MRPKIDPLYLLCLSCSVLLGCAKEANDDFTDTPVIESYLLPAGPVRVVISRQIPFSMSATFSSDDINALDIALGDGTSTVQPNAIGNGTYVDSTLNVTEGGSYTLSFLYNGKAVSATTSVLSAPTGFACSASELLVPPQVQGPPQGDLPEPLLLSWNNPDASYYFMVVQNVEAEPLPITEGTEGRDPKPFMSAPTNSNNAQIRALDFQYYGVHRVVLFHVHPDYAALYAQNSNSSQNLTNASTGIANGYGIFTGLNTDTLFVTVMQP